MGSWSTLGEGFMRDSEIGLVWTGSNTLRLGKICFRESVASDD